MARFEVVRTLEINAPAEKVFEIIADFGQWTAWSPWLIADPNAEVTVTENPNSEGSVYKWSGEVVGAGEIEHKKLVSPSRIEQELRFTKPFKSTSKVTFELEPTSVGTRTSWRMDGSLPWFLFWMRNQMKAFISMDYDRGLRMIRDLAQSGSVPSKTSIQGTTTIEPYSIVGVSGSCSFDNISESLSKAFAQVDQELEKQKIPSDGDYATTYTKFDPIKRTFEFIAGRTTSGDHDVKQPLTVWSTPSTKALCIEHLGSYDHLGNAWSAGNQVARYKKLKPSKISPFEVYKNSPNEAQEEALKTMIFLPMR